MANCSRGRSNHSGPARPPMTPSAPEPPVRRWPHPVEGAEACRPADGALHYIQCALSYQNQVLSEIKTLLQQMAAQDGTPPEAG